MRCLALANALAARGAQCQFVSRHLSDVLANRIRGAGHETRMLPSRGFDLEKGRDAGAHADWLGTTWQVDAADTAALIGSSCDWLVVDHYALDSRWHDAMRGKTRHILAIDDLADRMLACDALLDPNYRRSGSDPFLSLVPRECRRFSGPRMALLHPSFSDANARARVRDTARHAFVYFSVAPAEFHVTVLDALSRTNLTADLVGAPSVINDQQLADHVAVRAGQIRLHGPQPSLLPFMERADLAIGPVGSSTWERFATGLPTLAVTIAHNQEAIARDLAADDLIELLGPLELITVDACLASLEKLMDSGRMARMSQRTRALCDGRGAARLADALVAACSSE